MTAQTRSDSAPHNHIETTPTLTHITTHQRDTPALLRLLTWPVSYHQAEAVRLEREARTALTTRAAAEAAWQTALRRLTLCPHPVLLLMLADRPDSLTQTIKGLQWWAPYCVNAAADKRERARHAHAEANSLHAQQCRRPRGRRPTLVGAPWQKKESAGQGRVHITPINTIIEAREGVPPGPAPPPLAPGPDPRSHRDQGVHVRRQHRLVRLPSAGHPRSQHLLRGGLARPEQRLRVGGRVPRNRPGSGGIPGFTSRTWAARFLYRYRKPEPSRRPSPTAPPDEGDVLIMRWLISLGERPRSDAPR
jgi:hypothetical protein